VKAQLQKARTPCGGQTCEQLHAATAGHSASLEAIAELHAQDVTTVFVGTACQTTASRIRVVVHVGIFQEQVGVADIPSGVLAGAILSTQGYPVTVAVRQGGWAVVLVANWRLVPGNTTLEGPLFVVVVVGAQGDAPCVLEFQFQAGILSAGAAVFNGQARDAAPTCPGHVGQQLPARIQVVHQADNGGVRQLDGGFGIPVDVGSRNACWYVAVAQLGVAVSRDLDLRAIGNAQTSAGGNLVQQTGVPAPGV